MTYPEDVLTAAREAAAKFFETDPIYQQYADEIRSGIWDETSEVQSACIAIMAERQRCAGIAREKQREWLGSKTTGHLSTAASIIKAAILDGAQPSAILRQQETGGRRQRVGE